MSVGSDDRMAEAARTRVQAKLSPGPPVADGPGRRSRPSRSIAESSLDLPAIGWLSSDTAAWTGMHPATSRCHGSNSAQSFARNL